MPTPQTTPRESEAILMLMVSNNEQNSQILTALRLFIAKFG